MHARGRMVAGRLVDSSGEFFIQRQRAGPDGPAAAGDAAQDDARAAEWHQEFQVRCTTRAPVAAVAASSPSCPKVIHCTC
jgi:hypothetical protein